MSTSKTPLRYPGGKQKLTPFIEEILIQNNIDGHYIEPYAGGAGVALELLLSKKISFIHLNDSNKGIYSFWYSVLNHTQELCDLIASASLTVEEWKRHKDVVKKGYSNNHLELGFSIFYLNRCNRSGVLSAGVIGGLDQTGNYKMDARFNRNDLIRRIEAIALFRDKIFLSNHDAEYYIYNYIPNIPANTLVYLDPPYYQKGGDLYSNSYQKDDHKHLANVIQNNIDHRWILSYDGVEEILTLYDQRKHFLYDLQYSAGRVYKGKEVFVFSDKTLIPKESRLKSIQLALSEM